VIAQGYPLWLAEVDDGEVRAGRVVGWLVPSDEAGTPAPLVAFTLADGMLLETRPPRGMFVFLGDSRDEVVAAANRFAGGGPPAPLPADEPDAGGPPPRRRFAVHNTPADVPAGEPGGAEMGAPSPLGTRIPRTDH
jgi:hypothetical protein